ATPSRVETKQRHKEKPRREQQNNSLNEQRTCPSAVRRRTSFCADAAERRLGHAGWQRHRRRRARSERAGLSNRVEKGQKGTEPKGMTQGETKSQPSKRTTQFEPQGKSKDTAETQPKEPGAKGNAQTQQPAEKGGKGSAETQPGQSGKGSTQTKPEPGSKGS